MYASSKPKTTMFSSLVRAPGASMHNAEQRRIKLRYNGYSEKVQKTHKRLTATGSSANKRGITSVRLQPLSETPRLANNGKTNTWTMDNFVLLVVPGLSSIPAAVCLQHRDQRISLIISENWEHYQIQ